MQVLSSAIAVKAIEQIEEVQPSVFEIILRLESGRAITLMMNDVTAKLLAAQLVPHVLA